MAVKDEVDVQRAEGGMTTDDVAIARTTPTSSEREAEAWRNRRRSSRKRAVNARSIDVRRISRSELELGRVLHPDVDVDRPVTRADCVGGERPCLFISCKHHLYLDVSPRTGAIKLNFPDLEVDEMAETCVLDVADRGGTTVEALGTIMNLTRERVRQVEIQAFANIREALPGAEDDMPAVRKRRLPVVVEEDDDEDEVNDREEADRDREESDLDADLDRDRDPDLDTDRDPDLDRDADLDLDRDEEDGHESPVESRVVSRGDDGFESERELSDTGE